MAVFDYKCKGCGLRTEKLFRKEAPGEVTCPDCGGVSERQVAEFGFVFGDGKVPGNTGVDSLDRNLDKRIGRDAKGRWEYIKDRDTRKRQVQREHAEPEGGPVALQKLANGEYAPMTKQDVSRFNDLHRTNNSIISEVQGKGTKSQEPDK